MNLNVETNLAAVQRSVSFLERDGQSASAVTLSRRYATTVADLWDAVTSAERIPRWFLPVSGDLELGGATSWRATPVAPSRRANPCPISR